MSVRFCRALLAVAIVAGAAPAGAAPAELRSAGRIAFDGGSEVAASGDYVYAAETNADAAGDRGAKPREGGLHVIDVSGRRPREVGFLRCPGNDNDVEVVRPGLVAIGHHESVCNPPAGDESRNGVYFVDVRDPARPRVIGSVNLPRGMMAHTIKPLPGTDYVYVNPGGLPTNGMRTTHVVDVSRARRPRIAGSFIPEPSIGCHDMSFHVTRQRSLAFCSGYGETSIWDVSKPLKPEVIGRIHNPAIQFHHYPVASSDGKLLAIDDEAFAVHECASGESVFGRVWIYDISDPTVPTLASSFAPPRGGTFLGVGNDAQGVPSWCLAHGLDWEPGTRNLAVTWFSGGVSVLDLRDPAEPVERAYFVAPDSSTYSALWHRGRLYTNDTARGMEAFRL